MIEKYTLKNGIPVFVVENHVAPVVSIQAWVRRGSAYEGDRVAGISHFLEHALFKGTKKRKVGEIALEIERHGGEINAFTSFEETAYYTTLASRYFEDGLDVIADAIQNPAFDPDEMLREREVILEEIRRAKDSPAKMVSTNLWSTCFADTPFGRPVLGFVDTVEKINAKTLRTYFEKNYHANSTALFIVGDVSKEKALSLAKKKFNRMRTGKNPKLPSRLAVSPPKTPKVVTVSRDLKECHLQIGIPTGGIREKHVPALDLACSAIGQGESSPLYQKLVKEKRIALDAQMGLVATGRCGMLTLAMIVAPERLEEAIRDALSVITDAAKEGVQEADMERVRNSLESEVVSGKETVDGYARRLGYYYVQFGDPAYEKQYLEDLLAVPLEAATEALRDILKTKPVLSLAHPLDFKPDKKALIRAMKIAPLGAKAKDLRNPEPYRIEKGPVTYVSKQVDHLPVVAMKLIFPGGAREEDPSQLGISTIFHRVWNSGTRSYSSLQMAHILESLGASVSGFSGKNSVGLDVEFLSKHWPAVKPILAEVLTEPTFPEEEFETDKSILLRGIASERDNPSNLCSLNFMSTMYPDHYYGRSSLGTKETMESLTLEDLRQYFRNQITRSGVVVSSVGSFPSRDWEGEIQHLLERLPETGKTRNSDSALAPIESPQVVVAEKNPLQQSHLLVGFRGASFQSKDRYALKLLASSLAGQGGRLFLELRDRQSLAYTVAPINTDGPVPGFFGFYIGCAPEKVTAALTGIRAEIERLKHKPLPGAELKRAKEYWLGRFELERQRYGSQASLYGLDEYYGMDYLHSEKVPDILRGIKSNDIFEAADRVFSQPPVFSLVHPEQIGASAVLDAWNAKG